MKTKPWCEHPHVKPMDGQPKLMFWGSTEKPETIQYCPNCGLLLAVDESGQLCSRYKINPPK